MGTLRIDATVITQPGVAPFQTTVRVYRPLGGRRGAEFLARYPDFRRGIKIVLHHHERIDGAGYPGGLRGDDIPYGSRVIAVADSFDAMTSDRPYRGGMSIATATEVLAQGRGTQWDSTIVDAFISQVLPVLLSQSQSAPPAPRAADTTPVPGAVA